MRKPLAIDIYCGLGGWAEGLIAEGWRVVGFDNMACGIDLSGYPGDLVIQDVLTLHGSRFKNADLIVCSPPCQAYSYRAMPWKRAKALPPPDNTLFETCFRLQREASEAGGRHIPLIVENVRGAQKWVGRAKAHYGSYYLWGEVPALMPTSATKKRPGRNFHFLEKYGIPSPSFHGADHEPSVANALALKTVDHINQRNGHPHTKHLTNPAEHDGRKNNGGGWFNIGSQGQKTTSCNPAREGVKTNTRKLASAQIAKIPFPLAQYIARVFYPHPSTARG